MLLNPKQAYSRGHCNTIRDVLEMLDPCKPGHTKKSTPDFVPFFLKEGKKATSLGGTPRGTIEVIRGKIDTLLPFELGERSYRSVLKGFRREPIFHVVLLLPPLNNPQDPISFVPLW